MLSGAGTAADGHRRARVLLERIGRDIPSRGVTSEMAG